MFYSDGECPNCITEILHLNTLDLMECPKCNLMLSNVDGLVLGVINELGEGRFRFEDCNLNKIEGALIAKTLNNSPIADINTIFKNRNELKDYVKDLSRSSSKKQNKLWFSFKDSFKQYISNSPKENIKRILNSKTQRTSFYQNEVMPYIAESLNLVHGKEEFKVDYVMSLECDENIFIPKIYIESENEFNQATHEINKLCSLNTELRVLITAYTNKNISSIYPKLREWQCIIRTHKKINKSNFIGTVALIIGHISNNKLQYHSCSFWDDGDLSQPLSSFIEINFD